ncbi:hypothetical protein NFI96_026819 [Prochilodus magdalenae]|nr:hypothetical protein NFI96_026819 [Prochilodus magdalenae]
MLQFETLLLEQLQRQQSRAEFCDTVLQSQDVSVPVHSCVLSAFSPWLCGALSTMPTPVAGQKRLIELQHMEACTLLSLVSLLYSGQIDENRKDVLSAAELLGIRLPQEHTGETPGGRKRSGKESAVAEQQTENTSQGAMGQHVDRLEISGREKIRESSTQTEHERETDDRETQTDHICSDYQQHFHVIDHTACSSISHVQNTCTSAPDATVMLQGAQLSPVKTSSTCEPLPVAPETGVYHIVSEPECVSQVYLYPPEPSYHQPPIPVTSNNSYLEIGPVQSGARGVTLGVEEVVDGFEQFGGNIPGFISYFLDPAHVQSTGRRGRGRPSGRGRARGEKPARRARIRSRGEGTVRGRGRGRGRGRTGQSRTERWGWSPRLAFSGQGGGRVGRKLDTRPTGKHPVRLTRRRQGNRALVEIGEGRGRGRQRKRGRRGTQAVGEGQDTLPCLSSPRSHPHVCSLPLPPCSSSFCQNTMGAPEPSLLHTVSLPPAPQMSTQSIDLFLDDIMLGLNVLPPVHAENPTDQSGFVYAMTSNMSSVTKTQCPSINSLVKPTDASQQQPEGELFDILDHFLNTFEQHVAGCDLDAVEETANSQSQHFTAARSTDGTQVSKDPSKYTRPLKPHSNNCHMPHASVSSHFTSSTQLQPIRLSPADTSVGRNGPRLSATLRQRNSYSGTGSRSKLKSNEKEPQTQRVTRSQSRKRKLELTLSSLQSTKKRCRGKRSSGPVAFTDTERSQVRQRSHIPQKHVRCEDAVSNAGAGKSKPTQIQSTKGPKSTTTHSLYKKRQLETKSTEEKRCRTNAKGSNVETEHTSASSWTRQSPVKKKIGGAYIEMTSSAFEKMRMLLEKQRKGKEEYSRTKKSIGKPNENVGVVNVGEEERVSGVKGGSPAENTIHGYLEKSRADRADGSTVEAEDNARTVRAKTRGRQKLGCRPENKDVMAARMEQMMTNEHSRQCQTNLLPDTEPVRLTQVGEDSDHNNNEPFHSTAESSQSTFYSSLSHLVSAHAPHLPCSHQDLTPSAKSTRMVDLTVDLGEITPTTPVEGELSQHNLLSPEKAEQESAGGSEEDEEVDVLEVSSSASEPVTMSTAFWGPGLSSEEEDIEEDTDVDVLGMESD